MQPDPNVTSCTENVSAAKFDYKLNNIFRLHELPVSCIVMHPCRDYLISCSEDRLWKMVGLPQGNVLLTGSGHTDWLSGCCFHPRLSLKLPGVLAGEAGPEDPPISFLPSPNCGQYRLGVFSQKAQAQRLASPIMQEINQQCS
uniref:Uncharacterized protein n=1 Tax=Mus musculus TaxID=10090 RepID=Q9D4P2_MOUSE|nr:unnamed protein product [Mus musculus]